MSNAEFCQVWLTIGSKAEADKIANALLVKHLVACARQISVDSNFWWKDKINHSKEVLLQMESKTELFELVEKEIAKLHSYSTFVLEATPVTHISKSAAKWLNQELKNDRA